MAEAMDSLRAFLADNRTMVRSSSSRSHTTHSAIKHNIHNTISTANHSSIINKRSISLGLVGCRLHPATSHRTTLAMPHVITTTSSTMAALTALARTRGSRLDNLSLMTPRSGSNAPRVVTVRERMITLLHPKVISRHNRALLKHQDLATIRQTQSPPVSNSPRSRLKVSNRCISSSNQVTESLMAASPANKQLPQPGIHTVIRIILVPTHKLTPTSSKAMDNSMEVDLDMVQLREDIKASSSSSNRSRRPAATALHTVMDPHTTSTRPRLRMCMHMVKTSAALVAWALHLEVLMNMVAALLNLVHTSKAVASEALTIHSHARLLGLVLRADTDSKISVDRRIH